MSFLAARPAPRRRPPGPAGHPREPVSRPARGTAPRIPARWAVARIAPWSARGGGYSHTKVDTLCPGSSAVNEPPVTPSRPCAATVLPASVTQDDTVVALLPTTEKG